MRWWKQLIMFELLTELPWESNGLIKRNGWQTACSFVTVLIINGGRSLDGSVLICQLSFNHSVGTHESIFVYVHRECHQTSSWSEMCLIIANPRMLSVLLRLMVSVADQYKGIITLNMTWLILFATQKEAVCCTKQWWPLIHQEIKPLWNGLRHFCNWSFARWIIRDVEWVYSRNWIDQAHVRGRLLKKKLYEWNARVQITTWGNRQPLTKGGLRYAHKEWNGILKDFYYMRWKAYFDNLIQKMNGKNPEEIDFYTLEEPWTKRDESRTVSV